VPDAPLDQGTGYVAVRGVTEMGTWIAFVQIALALAAGWTALIPLMASIRARRGQQCPPVLARPVAPARHSGPRAGMPERVSGD